ncbi:hypothetical protein GALMADRAFT_565519 [Galerina marginata CBS 339.88]|uniref:Uncharacterized protein n=1 Tax=Galerina marginata (strain CBS 339.88) TaxID=685588 RepID=A0A067SV97_GALM3|nr:hypothetical protein GALMADRAFT_565519 [Galerina marginata CBS 339.88]
MQQNRWSITSDLSLHFLEIAFVGLSRNPRRPEPLSMDPRQKHKFGWTRSAPDLIAAHTPPTRVPNRHCKRQRRRYHLLVSFILPTHIIGRDTSTRWLYLPAEKRLNVQTSWADSYWKQKYQNLIAFCKTQNKQTT